MRRIRTIGTRRTAAAAAAALLLVALAGAGLARWWSRPPAGVLLASGTIEATEADVSPRIPGRVAERPVEEGDRIGAGALIARLESRELEAEVERLAASLEATETRTPQLMTEIALEEAVTRGQIADARALLAARTAKLAELRRGARPQELAIARAEAREAWATLENAAAALRRLETLFREGFVAEQARDEARAAYEVAAERHRNAQERLALVEEGPREEEIRRAEAEVREAEAKRLLARTGELRAAMKRQELETLEARIAGDRAALDAAKAQLGYAVVRSPMAGVVQRTHVEPGEAIAAGTPVATVADLSDIWLEIYVPEPRLGQVKLGQRAWVTTDSYPGKAYPGRVTFISPEAEFTPKNVQTREARVTLVFAVKVAVSNPDQELKPGMPADTRIVLDDGGGA